jgi:hypothetical protein
MAKYAVLDNSKVVTNLIVADDIETANTVTRNQCVEYFNHLDVAIGWTYDESTNTFVNPEENFGV